MPPVEVLIAFTIASLVLNLSPGPSNLYVMARSISQGMKGGMVASLGLATGSLLHVFAAVLGLSALFQHSPALYTAVKLIGAAYLIYLGIRYWRSSDPSRIDASRSVPQKSWSAIFRESVIVEATNPKTALFFIALLPQFVVPEAGPVWLQLLLLGAIVTVSALPCDFAVALFSSRLAGWLNRHRQAQRIQQRFSGSLLLGIGAFLIVEEARAR